MRQRTPLFGLSNKSKSLNVTAQRRINLYYEIRKQEDKATQVIYGTPGCRLFVNFGETPCRGAYEKDELTYFVHRNTLWEVNNAGVKVNRGNLNTSTGKVSIADNGYQISIVDGTTTGYIFNTDTNVFSLVTFPEAFITVCFLAGYFSYTVVNSGRYYVSDIYDGLVVDALSYANAESSPDDLVRTSPLNGQLVLFGQRTIEPAGVTDALDFPLQTIQGAAIQYGLAARWSIAEFAQGLMFLGRTQGGEVSVCLLRGGQVTEIGITDPEMANIFNKLPDLAAASAFSYNLDSHPMYELNIGGQTWLYDGLTSDWTKLESGNFKRHLGELKTSLLSRNLITDYSNGNVYFLEKDEFTDNGAPIAREIVSRHIFENMSNVFMGEFQLDMETGIGTQLGQGRDPKIMLTVSKDNGHTFGAERWKPIGKIGEYLTRVIWRQLGVSRDFVFKLRITDPVKVVIIGAYLEYQAGR